MIVDAHTHVGSRAHFSPKFVAEMVRAWGEIRWPEDDLAAHRKAMEQVDRAIVVAMDAPAVGMVVPNDYVSEYVSSHPGKLIGFASVDPSRPDALERLTFAADELGLMGLKVGPIYQHFDPTSPQAIALFRRAEKLGLPVLCHQGTTFLSDAPLRWARPFLIDDVARACPDLRLFIAHLGHPWCEETMAVIRKHPTCTRMSPPCTPGRSSCTWRCGRRWNTESQTSSCSVATSLSPRLPAPRQRCAR